MATLDTSKIILPNSVTTEVASKLHDTSVVAALSPADTLTGFTDDAYNYFTGGAVAEVVAEGAQKSSHDTAITLRCRASASRCSAPPVSALS